MTHKNVINAIKKGVSGFGFSDPHDFSVKGDTVDFEVGWYETSKTFMKKDVKKQTISALKSENIPYKKIIVDTSDENIDVQVKIILK